MLRNRKRTRKKIWRAYDARELKRLSDIIRGDERTYLIMFTSVKTVTDGSTISPLWPDSLAISNNPKELTPALIESTCQNLEYCDG